MANRNIGILLAPDFSYLGTRERARTHSRTADPPGSRTAARDGSGFAISRLFAVLPAAKRRVISHERKRRQSMDLGLAGKVALVAAAGRALGQASALAL